jgi:speckle-type POZ protein
MRRVVKKPSGVAIDLQKLINDKKTADVKLVVVDNNGRHEFHAHKLLLAARSKVFNEKFYGVGASSNVSELVLEEVADERVLTEFVHFLYTDTIEVVSDDTIKPLLALADKYDVPRLKIACGAFTAEKITNTNWMEILEFAAAQNEEDLVNDVVKYIGKNMRDESFDMIQLLSLKTPVFAAMLESDEFPLDELTIFGLANNWFEHNKTSVTEDEFRKVLRCVRFPMMDPLTLHTNVKGM